MSKSSIKRQSSNSTDDDNDTTSIGLSSGTIALAAIAIAVLIIVGFWLMGTQPIGALLSGDQIVGTWTDDNNYWAYAYYSNGSMQELGFYTHKTGSTSTHIPVYMDGTWKNIGNSQYSITLGDDQNNSTFTAVMNGNTMSVLNTSSSNTHKISNVADVDLVDFHYIT